MSAEKTDQHQSGIARREFVARTTGSPIAVGILPGLAGAASARGQRQAAGGTLATRPNALEARLIAELQKLEIIDAHEHTFPKHVRVSRKVDVLTLLSQYTSGDLVVAGMSWQGYERSQDPEIPLDERWRLAKPYWKRVRYGSYARAVRLALQKFYGADCPCQGPAKPA